MDKQRRSVIGWIARGLVALGSAGGVLLAGRFVRPARVRDLSRRIDLGPVSNLPAGAARHLRDPDVHVIHEAGGVYAVSGRCTHLGCSLLRRPEGFDCPCHGARFDLHGRPRSGPATRTLTWLRVSLRAAADNANHLVLHLDETVAPGTMKRV